MNGSTLNRLNLAEMDPKQVLLLPSCDRLLQR